MSKNPNTELTFLARSSTISRHLPPPSDRPEQVSQPWDKALSRFGLETVCTWAEEYAIEVKRRTKGGGIARPENFLWKKLYGHSNEVIDVETMDRAA